MPQANERRAEFLQRCVELGKNVVIAGETGSGKTTFMKALMQCIPTSERIITIEDVPELVYGLPNHDTRSTSSTRRKAVRTQPSRLPACCARACA